MRESALSLSRETFGGSELPEEVIVLLAKRISRYTMGDSTSVPIETGTRLLEGIAYCTALHRSSDRSEVAMGAPLEERFFAGVAEAKRLTRRAKLLLCEAQRRQPPVVNIGFQDTLSALPGFFQRYDADFFAQEIPCSIDYPLCQPVPDALLGIEYLLEYLRCWLAESRLLRCFSKEALVRLYERYYGDYDGLLVNLYLPVAEMATLCALAEMPVRALSLSEEELGRAAEMLTQADETSAQTGLADAVNRVLDEAGVSGERDRVYLLDTARDLRIRMRAAIARRPEGITDGLL